MGTPGGAQRSDVVIQSRPPTSSNGRHRKITFGIGRHLPSTVQHDPRADAGQRAPINRGLMSVSRSARCVHAWTTRAHHAALVMAYRWTSNIDDGTREA
jgi:hypothetical protein